MPESGVYRVAVLTVTALVVLSATPVSGALVSEAVSQQSKSVSSQAGPALSVEGFTDVSDNVSVWDGSPFALRTEGTNAVTELQVPDVLVTDENSGETSLDKRTLFVYEQGSPISVTFSEKTGADTTRYNGDDVGLLVARVTPDSGSTLSFSTAFNLSTNLSSDAVNRNFTFLTEITGSVSDGTASFNYTPQKSGQYVFILTRNASNTTINSGNLTLDGQVQVLGVDTAPVQSQSASATPSSSSISTSSDVTVQPGDNFTFSLSSNLDESNITHAVLLVDESRFRDESFTVNVTGNLTELSGDNVTISRTIEGVNGVQVIESDARVLGTDLSSERSVGITSLTGVFDFLANATTGDGPTDEVTGTTVIDASTVVTTGDSSKTVTVETLSNFSTGAYKFVYVASTENGSKFTTTDGTVFVKKAVQLNVQVSPGQIRKGNSVTVTVIRSDTGARVANAQVSVAGKTVRTNANGVTTVSIGSTGTFTGTVQKAATDRTVFQQATFQVTVTQPPRNQQPQQPQQPPTPPEPPETGPTIDFGENRTTVTVPSVQPNNTVNVPVAGVKNQNGTGVGSLDITSSNASDQVTVEVTVPQDQPTEDAPSLSTARRNAQALEYFSVTVSGLSDQAVTNATITFTLPTSQIPQNRSRDDVKLYRFVNGDWRELETTPLAGNQYRAQAGGFSPFAIGIEQPAPSFRIAASDIGDEFITTAETTTATIVVENNGTAAGTFQANLTVAGEVVETRTVEIPAGETQEITFDLSFDEPGTRDISISGTSLGSVTVIAEDTPTDTPTPTETPTDTPTQVTTESPTPPETSTTFPGFTTAIGVLALLGAALLLARRQE